MSLQNIAQSHVTTNYGGLAALLLAGYLGAVVWQTNTGELMTALKGEFGFIKWMIALVVVWVIIQESGPGLGTSIAVLAFLAMAIVAGNKIFPQMQQFFKGN